MPPTPTPQWNTIVKDCVQGDTATIGCIPAIFSNLINALLMFVGLFALAIFIMGGFKLIHSGGDPKKLEGARHSFVFGIVGLLIVLLSFAIINIISYVTGVGCITKFGFGCE